MSVLFLSYVYSFTILNWVQNYCQLRYLPFNILPFGITNFPKTKKEPYVAPSLYKIFIQTHLFDDELFTILYINAARRWRVNPATLKIEDCIIIYIYFIIFHNNIARCNPFKIGEFHI